MRFQERRQKIQSALLKHRIFVIISFIVIVYASYSLYSGGEISALFSTDAKIIQEQIDSFGPFGFFIFVVFIVLEVLIAPIPSVILYAVGGAVYGTMLGSLLIFIGNIIGASIAYLITRYLLRDYAAHHAPERLMRQFDYFTDKYGSFAIFFLRLNPFTSSDMVSYLAGVSKLPFRKFIVATGLGLLPLIVLQAYVGSDFIADNPALFTFFIILSALYVVAFMFIPIIGFFKHRAK